MLGALPPGAHIGQFYRDREDLVDTLVPFFVAGLHQHERCIWVCSKPLCALEARAALAGVVPDLEDRERNGEIEIVDHEAWYLRNGRLGPDEVIRGWLDAEEQALAAGYSGLRISGNVYWLAPEQWDEFAEYEARVHQAFRDRKIVAMCSYPLSSCDSHHVVDVLHNHSVSLVRGESGWDVVHGATAALAALEHDVFRARAETPHSVEFYREQFPVARVAARLAEALADDRGAAAVASEDHARMIRAALAARGIDVEAAVSRGQLALVDAGTVFAEAWSRPGLVTEVLDTHLLAPLRELVAHFGSVVAFGELVDLFAKSGDRDGAIALERWWNQQIAKYPIELACGYSLDSFDDTAAVEAFRHVCDEHSDVGVDASPTASEADRLRAELAQVTNALAKETGRRQIVESAYASARSAREHLVLLHRLTATLGEVTTRAQFVEQICDTVKVALGAFGIGIVETLDTGERIMLVADGVAEDVLLRAAALSTTRALWSDEPAALGGFGLGAFAVAPVAVGDRRLATLVLGFERPRHFAAPYRALVEDVARQLALALERAISYERLEQERRRAESASRAKDEFLAMLGHELRNPLSPILTATQLMRLRGEDVFDKERTVIERQVKHMIRLVDDLLDVSRITRGKVDLRRRPIEVSEVVAQAVELSSPAMEERAHRLTLDVPRTGVVVHADPHRLAQVIANLLTNAAKYTPHGGCIQLTVRAHDSTVTISVKDTGIGIDAKLLPQVFELFVQGRQGIDRAAGGLGLGLAIARTLVELHGGTVRARSDGQGQGSEFIVELPRHANTRPSRQNVSGAFALSALRPCNVLVVDDNEDAAALFSEALRNLGHHVEIAHDGPTALAVARRQAPQICFLDIGLPVMDGYELGRRLRELPGTPPKLVAVTGYGNTTDRDRSRDAGFDLHLVKPVDLSAIQDALAKLHSRC